MTTKIKCPKCHGTDLQMYDHQPLAIAMTAIGNGNLPADSQFDNELYGEFLCDCGHKFSKTLEIRDRSNLTLSEIRESLTILKQDVEYDLAQMERTDSDYGLQLLEYHKLTMALGMLDFHKDSLVLRNIEE